MDDLAGLSWTPSSNEPNQKPPPMSSGFMNTMRVPPIQARPTPPPSSNGHSSNPPSKPATPANDSFANLVSFGSSTTNKNLSLLEQQKKLQEQKAKQEAEKRSRYEAQFGGQNAQFWDNLDQKGSARIVSPAPAAPIASPDEDDILAAFNAATPVDASTNFPIPATSASRSATQSPLNLTIVDPAKNMGYDDDDDPFGLGTMQQSRPAAVQPTTHDNNNNDDDDDFLGLLGKPVSEAAPARAKSKSPAPSPQADGPDPRDRAVAELVDMGFPPEKAAEALRNTESGVDVQAAVGWLLNQAHSESRQKARSKAGHAPEELPQRSREEQRPRQQNVPSWMREGEAEGRRGESRSPQPHERDVGEMAASFGNSLFKTANSLWKQGSKKVQQAVQEFNGDVDPNQPKWMREAATARSPEERGHRPRVPEKDTQKHIPAPQKAAANITDEALLLESGAGRPTRGAPRRNGSVEPRHKIAPAPLTEETVERHENRNPFRQPQPQPQKMQQQQQQQQRRPQGLGKDVKSQLNRSALEEQSAQAYVSPARRRRQQQQPAPSATNEDNSIDLLDSSKPQTPVPTKAPAQAPMARASKPSTPIPHRPRAPARTIPSVSQSALLSSHKERESGNDAYKRGDYGAAHEAFTKALSHLPKDHPVTMLVLTNRAMTALKIGEPKIAISDADTVLAFIGPARGEGETIELGNGQPAKPMKDIFGKALMRKAEALEHIEKWVDAAQTWKMAVEAGHGGSTSIQGRNRCEKAAGINKPAPAAAAASRPPPKKASPAPPRTSALSELSSQKAAPTAEAVTRLRAANEAAERADEEKLALTDSVDAKITAWREGKQDNLRALLGSLENVLWPESGWKKINMSELILANKVKIQYMKGIAKVHPDKIPTNATTEQRMIAGAVFSTLNEAWDKFRQENNL